MAFFPQSNWGSWTASPASSAGGVFFLCSFPARRQLEVLHCENIGFFFAGLCLGFSSQKSSSFLGPLIFSAVCILWLFADCGALCAHGIFLTRPDRVTAFLTYFSPPPLLLNSKCQISTFNKTSAYMLWFCKYVCVQNPNEMFRINRAIYLLKSAFSSFRQVLIRNFYRSVELYTFVIYRQCLSNARQIPLSKPAQLQLSV